LEEKRIEGFGGEMNVFYEPINDIELGLSARFQNWDEAPDVTFGRLQLKIGL